MKILVTGAAGFVGGYIVKDLLEAGFEVVGVDNFSKYGVASHDFSAEKKYTFIEGDCKDSDFLREHLVGCEHMIAGAAMIGGITYFHKFAYDLIAENERIAAASFDAAIDCFRNHKLKKITVLSSSMVFENCNIYPTPEHALSSCPPPSSTYGFQKLAVEYFAKGAFEQYGLPYTIIRPFNCIGIGEGRANTDEEVLSGNIKLAMSHVLPDLAQKVLKGQDPIHILGEGNQVRHYTHGADLARGIRLSLENDAAKNNDFNISTSRSTTVLELAELVWKEVHGDRPFQYVSDAAYQYDVQKRVPDTTKALRLLDFEAQISLEDSIKEVVSWVRKMINDNKI